MLLIIHIIHIIHIIILMKFYHIYIYIYIYKLKDGDIKKYTLRNYHEYNIIKNIL